MKNQKIYKALATAIQAKKNCEKNGNDEWYERWDDRIEAIMETAPSGSGFDNGTHLVEEDACASTLGTTTWTMSLGCTPIGLIIT